MNMYKRHSLPSDIISYTVWLSSGQSLELFEIRPVWNDPGERIEQPVAKATFVKKTNTRKVYWPRQDLRRHRCVPDPDVDTLEEFLAVVAADAYPWFWG